MNEKGYKIIIAILMAIIMALPIYFQIAYKPRNSIELYRAIQWSEDYSEAQKLSLKGYEKNFSNEMYEEIVNSSTSPNSVNQFTVLPYDGESYIIETTPGTTKLEILRVVKIPEELKDYFSELTK